MPDETSASMQPQDAFRELALITLADHTLDNVMDKVAGLTKRTVPGASEVSVTVTDGGDSYTVAFTGQLAMALDERQYARGYGPCLACIEGGEPVLIAHMAGEHRWGPWAQDAVKAGARSSLSIPVPVQREVSAALNIYSTGEDAFDEASVELAQTLGAYAGVALANVHLYQALGKAAEQLQHAMQSRAAVEQAKGILMGQRGCTADEAFTILVMLSQDSNRKLREVSQALIDQAVDPPS